MKMIKFNHILNQKDRKVTAVGTRKCDSCEITKAVFSERLDKIKPICSVNECSLSSWFLGTCIENRLKK